MSETAEWHCTNCGESGWLTHGDITFAQLVSLLRGAHEGSERCDESKTRSIGVHYTDEPAGKGFYVEVPPP